MGGGRKKSGQGELQREFLFILKRVESGLICWGRPFLFAPVNLKLGRWPTFSRSFKS